MLVKLFGEDKSHLAEKKLDFVRLTCRISLNILCDPRIRFIDLQGL